MVNKMNSKVEKTRTYALVEHKNEIKMACKIDDEWIIDKTCSNVNRLMRDKVISCEQVKDWLSIKPSKDSLH